jgi:hypothetical protein
VRYIISSPYEYGSRKLGILKIKIIARRITNHKGECILSKNLFSDFFDTI